MHLTSTSLNLSDFIWLERGLHTGKSDDSTFFPAVPDSAQVDVGLPVPENLANQLEAQNPPGWYPSPVYPQWGDLNPSMNPNVAGARPGCCEPYGVEQLFIVGQGEQLEAGNALSTAENLNLDPAWMFVGEAYQNVDPSRQWGLFSEEADLAQQYGLQGYSPRRVARHGGLAGIYDRFTDWLADTVFSDDGKGKRNDATQATTTGTLPVHLKKAYTQAVMAAYTAKSGSVTAGQVADLRELLMRNGRWTDRGPDWEAQPTLMSLLDRIQVKKLVAGGQITPDAVDEKGDPRRNTTGNTSAGDLIKELAMYAVIAAAGYYVVTTVARGFTRGLENRAAGVLGG